jgi:large subunit ribosomal protein L20
MPAFAKKKYIKLSKGFFGAPGRRLAAMIPAVDKSLRYAYISRRLRPRDFKSEWIQTIGSAVR